VILFDTFGKHPKSKAQPFEEYFREILEKMPIGSLDREYDKITNKN
jgi:hypothetical protein